MTCFLFTTDPCHDTWCNTFHEEVDIHKRCTFFLLHRQLHDTWVSALFICLSRKQFQISEVNNCKTLWLYIRDAMIPCILLALGGNLINGKSVYSLFHINVVMSPTLIIWLLA